MEKIKISNLAKFYSLFLLFEKPCHGYELIKNVGKILERKISPGEMYPFLKKLEKNDLVISKKKGKRDKRVYRLSPKGKKFCKKMLYRFAELIEAAIEPKLKICANCGCKLFESGFKEKINNKKMTFCCKHCAKSFKQN
jgi:DNA-binding PadR family transcriptional regulator